MRLFAAVIPPPHVLAELAEVVRAVAPGTPELTPVPLEEMMLRVTSFGNVAQRDQMVLLEALAAEAAHWPAPRLRFAGGTALEWRGDENVWAKLAGDVDALNQACRGVPPVVQRLGFLVDRRAYRPMLAVGSITDATTAPYLEKLVAELEAFRGEEWVLEELTVMRRLPVEPGRPGPSAEVFRQLPLRG